jgi:hypothetical protein
MTRFSIRPVAGALAACTLSAATLLTPFALSPAEAHAGAAFYHATLVSPLAEPKQEILDGVAWNCAGDACTGTKSGSRAVIVCGRLANRVGEIASFSAAGDVLGARQLAACNKG